MTRPNKAHKCVILVIANLSLKKFRHTSGFGVYQLDKILKNYPLKYFIVMFIKMH